MKLKTLTLIAVILCINLLSGAPVATDQVVIIQIEGLTGLENVEIHDLFKHDTKVQVVNSCQILGLVVFKSDPDKNISIREVEAYVQVKLKSLSRKKEITVLNDISMNQVNLNCRAEVAKIKNSK